MTIRQWWKSFCFSAHDRRGNAKRLLSRTPARSLVEVPGVSAAVRDEALKILCDAFDIPERQMYCLRSGDNLMSIYQSMNGPRNFDQLQFERLNMSLDALPGEDLSMVEIDAIKTVGDLVRTVAARRAQPSRGPGRA